MQILAINLYFGRMLPEARFINGFGSYNSPRSVCIVGELSGWKLSKSVEIQYSENEFGFQLVYRYRLGNTLSKYMTLLQNRQNLENNSTCRRPNPFFLRSIFQGSCGRTPPNRNWNEMCLINRDGSAAYKQTQPRRINLTKRFDYLFRVCYFTVCQQCDPAMPDKRCFISNPSLTPRRWNDSHHAIGWTLKVSFDIRLSTPPLAWIQWRASRMQNL